jgi:hypothetical protein
MKNIILILAIILLAASTARADVISISLDSSTLSGAPGSVLEFFGTLTNTTDAVVYLNADNINSSLPDPSVIDSSPFFNNAPFFLDAPGTTGDIGLFNVTILNSFAPGNYDGTFMVVGGAGADSQDILGSADFTVHVVDAAGGIPEPSMVPFLVAGVGVLFFWKRLRDAHGRHGPDQRPYR